MPAAGPFVLAACLALPLVLVIVLSQRRDKREPPHVASSLPLVGHAWGMATQKFEYLLLLSRRVSLPIFTINLLGLKMYVITTPELVATVQKHHKTLAFPPLEAEFATVLCSPSKHGKQVLNANANGDSDAPSLLMEANHGMRNSLKPGAELDEIRRLLAATTKVSLDQICTTSKPRKLCLHAWLKTILTEVSIASMYGREHPFRDVRAVDAFWTLVQEITPIILGLAPSVFARKGLAARKFLAVAFEEYFHNSSHEASSQFTRVRYEVGLSNGLSVKDTARFEINAALAILVNTIPAAFWTLFYVYSHPDLLRQIRHEVDAVTVVEASSSGTRRSLDMTSLERYCPLLVSTYNESLRHRAVGVSVRRVMEDTWIDGQYLLKKGSLLQIPSRVIHRDPTVWGADPDVFNPRRFLAGEQGLNNKSSSSTRFRTFGGGKTLCPGRHSATSTILGLVGSVVARFDLVPVAGHWTAPSAYKTGIATALEEPDTDIEVEFSEREGFTNTEWVLKLYASDEYVPY